MQLSGASQLAAAARDARSRWRSSTSRCSSSLVYAFNTTRVQKWPPAGLTFSWFHRALHNPGVRDALATSVKCGLLADRASRSCSARWPPIAVARYRFFGREAISFLVVLPIALPGIVTGMALNATFTQVLGVSLGLLTIVIGHATFCIVVVFNNVVARLRRTPTSFEEASADLGATACRPSATSPSRRCARRSSPARCSPSP